MKLVILCVRDPSESIRI